MMMSENSLVSHINIWYSYGKIVLLILVYIIKFLLAISTDWHRSLRLVTYRL